MHSWRRLGQGKSDEYTEDRPGSGCPRLRMVTISYRLSGEAPFPAAIQDCKAAVRFLRANAKELGIDPNKIGAIGLSAGGHLTALLASSHGVDELKARAVIRPAAVAFKRSFRWELKPTSCPSVPAKYQRNVRSGNSSQGGSQDERPKAYRLASPLEHLDEDDPPCLFITGETDDERRATKFRKRMTDFGLSSGIEVIEGAPHGFLTKQVWFDRMIDAADAHFMKFLK